MVARLVSLYARRAEDFSRGATNGDIGFFLLTPIRFDHDYS